MEQTKLLEQIAEQTYDNRVPQADQKIAQALRDLLGSLSIAIATEEDALRYFMIYKQKVDTIIEQVLRESFEDCFKYSAEVFNLPINNEALKTASKRAANEPWLGRTFHNSLGKNTGVSYQKYNDLLSNAIATGKDHRAIVEEVKDLLNITFNDAKRLVRTEVMYQINQAQKEVYISKGYTKYQFMATIDSRTSAECRDLNGKEFYFSEAVVGVNFPCLHPNCRSTIVPVIK